MIIFSERCTLKKVPEDEQNLMIMKRKDVVDNTNAKLFSLDDRIFTEKEVDELYEKLKMYSDVNEEIKQKHINDFKK